MVCEDSDRRHFFLFMDNTNFVTRDIAVLPVIADMMVEMQVRHSLPLELILKEKVNNLQVVEFKYCVEDEYMVDWVTCKCIDKYLPSL